VPEIPDRVLCSVVVGAVHEVWPGGGASEWKVWGKREPKPSCHPNPGAARLSQATSLPFELTTHPSTYIARSYKSRMHCISRRVRAARHISSVISFAADCHVDGRDDQCCFFLLGRAVISVQRRSGEIPPHYHLTIMHRLSQRARGCALCHGRTIEDAVCVQSHGI
jgi:hypothetical protein